MKWKNSGLFLIKKKKKKVPFAIDNSLCMAKNCSNGLAIRAPDIHEIRIWSLDQTL